MACGTWRATGPIAKAAGVPGFSAAGGDQATFNLASGVTVDLASSSPSIAALTFGSVARELYRREHRRRHAATGQWRQHGHDHGFGRQ